jgi:serine protease Do
VKKLVCFLLVCFSFTLLSRPDSRFSIEEATVEAAESIGKSVVSISSVVKQKIDGRFYFGSPFGELEEDPFRGFFREFFGEGLEREYRRMGLGSGVIIDDKGYILTNEHVIKGASEIKVKLSDGREFDAKVQGIDPRSDLAVVKIEAEDLSAAKLGDSSRLRTGQWVLAVGDPFGFAIENPEPTVTIGVVSALRRYLPGLGKRERGYSDLIQTDAAINPGNSGGPLVNLKGEVIGINTAIITTTGGYQGLGFAVPINKAKRVVERLIKGEKVLYGWLGVNIQDLNDDLRNYFAIKETRGVIVLKVYQNSPAARAGLKEGDLILAFNNQPVRASRDLINMVANSEVGDSAAIDIVRGRKKITADVVIGASPDSTEGIPLTEPVEEASFWGMTVDDITQVYERVFNIEQQEGVVVVEIEPDSAAAASGLTVGDIILKIEKKDIKNKEEFIDAVSGIKGKCLIKTNRGYIVLRGPK